MPDSFTSPVDLSAPEFRRVNHIATSSTFKRCHNCPRPQTSSIHLKICSRFVSGQTPQFQTKEFNSGFAADSFLGVTGSFTVLNDVQDDSTNISGAQKDEGQSTVQGSTRRSKHKECSSKYYGVRFRPDLSKWVAEIRVAEWKSVDKKVWLGTYISEEGAACAVDAARKILKCSKKNPPNISCDRLEAYTESLPPGLSLNNVSDTKIFKAITQFVKGKARQYASEITSTTTLPVLKKIRTFYTPVHGNSQPTAGDESTSDTVVQLGSVHIEFPSISFEPWPYLDHTVNAIELMMPRNFSPPPSHIEQLSPFDVTAATGTDNFLEYVDGKELLEGYGITPLSSTMFWPGASLDWPQQPEDGLMMPSQPEAKTDQIFNLDFKNKETFGDPDVWVEKYLGSCSEEHNDALMEGRETKLVPSFKISSEGDGINLCMDAFLQGIPNGHQNSN